VGKTTVVTQVLKDLKTLYLSVSADDTNSNPSWIDQQYSTARERAKQLEFTRLCIGHWQQAKSIRHGSLPKRNETGQNPFDRM
jgi:hypothetical protein